MFATRYVRWWMLIACTYLMLVVLDNCRQHPGCGPATAWIVSGGTPESSFWQLQCHPERTEATTITSAGSSKGATLTYIIIICHDGHQPVKMLVKGAKITCVASLVWLKQLVSILFPFLVGWAVVSVGYLIKTKHAPFHSIHCKLPYFMQKCSYVSLFCLPAASESTFAWCWTFWACFWAKGQEETPETNCSWLWILAEESWWFPRWVSILLLNN